MTYKWREKNLKYVFIIKMTIDNVYLKIFVYT